MTARERVKSALKARADVQLVNPMHPSGSLVEHLASRGFDLILIDCEHRGADFETVEELARAARAGGGASIVRPWSMEPGLVARFLHCGADGLLLPHLHDAGQIAEFRQLARDHRPRDAESLILIGLVEEAETVRRLGQVLTPELDGILVGPGDLAVSLGLPRRGPHPEVRAKVFEALNAARAAGVSAGAPLSLGREALLEAGANIRATDLHALIKSGLTTFQAPPTG
jgi:2-keto-3-deoxy-L-rhamnonate aldolase RhmA